MFINYTNPDSIITDGKLAVSYYDIPYFLERLHEYFLHQGIKPTDCLALEGCNSVLSALVIIYFFREKIGFVLLHTCRQNPQSCIPQFCHYRVVIKDSDNQEIIDLKHPEKFLCVISLGNHCSLSFYGKIYLKTSGSTGSPKLLIHEHDKLVANAANCAQTLSLGSDDRITIPVLIFHMYGLGAAFLPALIVGASIDLQLGFNLSTFLKREKEFHPNIAFMSPFYGEFLLRERKSSRLYKFTIFAGDKLRENSFWEYESRFGCVLPLYGSTEMGVIAAASLRDSSELRVKTVGQPVQGVKLYIEKDDLAEELLDVYKGDFGKLYCQHPYGFIGYADKNGEPISAQVDSFFTKDLGRIYPNNYLKILGRCDYSVKRSGVFVLLTDIEQAIASMQGIIAVSVVAKGVFQFGVGIVAYCVLARESTLTESIVRAMCFDLLPKRAVPDRIYFLPNLPLLPNGKVDRNKLVDAG